MNSAPVTNPNTPLPTQGPVRPAERPAPDAAAREAGLRRAAKEFEALFVNQLMKNMRSTVIQSDLIDTGGGIETYRQLLDEEMSKQAAEGPNGLGIARMIMDRYLAAQPDTRDDEAGMRPLPERPAVRRALAAYGADGGSPPRQVDDLRERAGAFAPAAADTLDRFGDHIAAAADETGLDRELILAVIMQESSGRPDAVSRVGARGLMQLMPATAAELGVDDPHDPAQNIRGGARYLASLRERFAGDLDLALAGYNAGPGRVERAGRSIPAIDETRNYVRRVGDAYHGLKDALENDVSEGGATEEPR